ncbi:MAG: hypothetical protein PHP95_16635 [Desulfuromonadaceae bacterium]|nr:hypothetical protein [Desulfuromonadaceae bacterium]MDD2850078.1 hypothetical protein [Desulfuromonadaceae bacterium]MDD4131866.1 hypothetical protein [Desulfuromonadaceae bacterium]
MPTHKIMQLSGVVGLVYKKQPDGYRFDNACVVMVMQALFPQKTASFSHLRGDVAIVVSCFTVLLR